MIPVTDEMLQAFNGADFSGCGNADWEDSHLRIGLAAVLAIVERDHAREVAELRRAFDTAAESRDMWRRRALEGWDTGAICPATVDTRGELVRCGKRLDSHDTHLGRSRDGWDVIW